jgi:hypothetical protein
MNQMLQGAIAVGLFAISLFFLRFWRQTRDGFFLLFALSFAIETVSRTTLAMLPEATESEPFFYGLRLLSYGLILVAIWQKNRPRRK